VRCATVFAVRLLWWYVRGGGGAGGGVVPLSWGLRACAVLSWCRCTREVSLGFFFTIILRFLDTDTDTGGGRGVCEVFCSGNRIIIIIIAARPPRHNKYKYYSNSTSTRTRTQSAIRQISTAPQLPLLNTQFLTSDTKTALYTTPSHKGLPLTPPPGAAATPPPIPRYPRCIP